MKVLDFFRGKRPHKPRPTVEGVVFYNHDGTKATDVHVCEQCGEVYREGDGRPCEKR